MEGRENDDDKEEYSLPGHMNNIHNRNSLDVLTKKTLKMNNYINGEMKNYFSSFNKKSFNLIINYNMLKNGKEIGNLKEPLTSPHILDDFYNQMNAIYEFIDYIKNNEKLN